MQQENVEPQTLAPPLLAVFFFVLCFCFVLGGAVFVFTATTTTTTTTIAASIEQVPIFVTYWFLLLDLLSSSCQSVSWRHVLHVARTGSDCTLYWYLKEGRGKEKETPGQARFLPSEITTQIERTKENLLRKIIVHTPALILHMQTKNQSVQL